MDGCFWRLLVVFSSVFCLQLVVGFPILTIDIKKRLNIMFHIPFSWKQLSRTYVTLEEQKLLIHIASRTSYEDKSTFELGH